MKVKHPWQTGPTELITYAIEHLERRSDFAQRIGFLLLDLGVETLFKTYLELPEGVTGATLSHAKRREALEGNFHQLLEAVREAAGGRLKGVDLEHVRFYHNLRNKLYHEGDGITVPADKARGYASLAAKLLRKLLGVDVASQRDFEYRVMLDGFDGGSFICDICGQALTVGCGPVFYRADTLKPVCYECGTRHDVRGEATFWIEQYWESCDEDRENYVVTGE